VPDTTTCCDPVPALSVTIRFALDPPVAVGANVTLIVQFSSGSTVVQLLVCLNSPAPAPPNVTLFTVSATAPVLVSITGVGLLLVPTVCAGKVTEAGENLVPGTGTVVLIRTKMLPIWPSMTTRSCLPSPFMSAACAKLIPPSNCEPANKVMYGPNVPSPFPRKRPLSLNCEEKLRPPIASTFPSPLTSAKRLMPAVGSGSPIRIGGLNVPSPFPRNTALPPTMSGLPSPFTSAVSSGTPNPATGNIAGWKVPSPSPSRTPPAPETMSSLASRLKSALTIEPPPSKKYVGGKNVPFPFPSNTATESLPAGIARSGFPSPLKSAITTVDLSAPTFCG